MDFDLLIKGGTIVRHNGRQRADIGISSQKIVEIGALDGRAAEEVIDAAGRLVLPGVIDPHVHLTILPEAGNDERQLEVIMRDLVTESQAAAFGGVTTFLPMINLQGPYLPRFDDLVQAIDSSSAVDAGATVIVSSLEHVEEIDGLAQRGVSGFKHFLNAFPRDSTVGSLLPVGEETFFLSLRAIAAVGRPGLAMVHAEDAELNMVWETHYRAERAGAVGLRALAEARPPVAEILRMHYAATAGEALGAPIYLCHCTSFAGLEAARTLKHRGNRLAVEAVTHCLTSNCDDAWEQVGVWGKFFPPIRAETDRRALWSGVRDRTIGHIASDHTTWTREEKENGVGQFGSVWDATPGIANGMEHLLPALITHGVHRGEVSWEELVRATSYNTAALFGYLPQKGDIGAGFDADLVVIDPGGSETVGESYYHGRGKDWSLYWGQQLHSRPEITIVRGQIVQQRGKLVAANVGRYVGASYPSRATPAALEA